MCRLLRRNTAYNQNVHVLLPFRFRQTGRPAKRSLAAARQGYTPIYQTGELYPRHWEIHNRRSDDECSDSCPLPSTVNSL